MEKKEKSKVDQLVREYKKHPTVKNKNLLAAECLIYVKKFVQFKKTQYFLDDLNDLESYLSLRVVQNLLTFDNLCIKDDTTKDFESLLVWFLNKMVKNYSRAMIRDKIRNIIIPLDVNSFFLQSLASKNPSTLNVLVTEDIINKMCLLLTEKQLVVFELLLANDGNKLNAAKTLGKTPGCIDSHIKRIRKAFETVSYMK